MTTHFKLPEVTKLVEAGVSVMLTGEKGSGKTTIASQVAKNLDLSFFTMSMTRQTTLSLLLGFRSVTGVYIPTPLRSAVEKGGIFLLDEIDAADPNVLLSLNTIENGYVSFPDAMVDCHKNFRLMATANPQNEHHHYTGRAKLDAATLDRFDIIDIDRDQNLEASLVDSDTLRHIQLIRQIISKNNADLTISMRDSMRFQLRKDLDLLEGFTKKIFGDNAYLYTQYEEERLKMPKFQNQEDCITFEDLTALLKT